MAEINGPYGLTTSPNSSEELDSDQATPATKTSLFSPHNAREALKSNNTGIIRSKVPPAFVLTQAQPTLIQHHQAQKSPDGATQDPFVSGPKLSASTQFSADTSKLSPIASTFTPQSLLASSPSSSVALSELSGSVTLPPQQLQDLQSKLVILAAPSGRQVPLERPETLRNLWYKPSNEVEYAKGYSATEISHSEYLSEPRVFKDASQSPFSTDEGISRYLMISQIATDCPMAAIERFFSSGVFRSVKNVVFTDLVMESTVYVRFGDMRDVLKATDTIENTPWGWSVKFIDPHVFVIKAQPGVTQILPISKFEAQVLVTARTFKSQNGLKIDKPLSDLVREFLSRSGDLMALEELYPATASEIIYRAEFQSVDAVDRLLASGTWLEVDRFILNTKRYEPDLELASPQTLKRVGPLIIGEDEIGLSSALQNIRLNGSHMATQQETTRSIPFSSFVESTPTGRSLTSRKDIGGHHTPSSLNNSFSGFDRSSSQTSPFWSPTYTSGSSYGIPSSTWSPNSPGAVGQERGAMPSPSHGSFYQNQLGNGSLQLEQPRSLYKGSRRQSEHNIGTHNVVDANRIRYGIDVRTTIMLRNIPNKMTSAVLKGILDETSFGKYDFTYLRIDFANNCNVGYAFINFEDPIHIVNFVNARAGRRWNCYNSDKVAEISYATIQGRDCLVQKFRNSSVMLEQPSSRPKIWSTSGATMGQEEAFPGPDNPSKMRRSVENAEHVGLFAPRAGQNFRDEQRRRRSQYDRGTRFADIEDSYNTTAYQYRDSPNPIDVHLSSAASYQQQFGQIYYARAPGT